LTLEKSLKYAIAAGTLVVTVRGDQENLPSLEELEIFLDSLEEDLG